MPTRACACIGILSPNCLGLAAQRSRGNKYANVCGGTCWHTFSPSCLGRGAQTSRGKVCRCVHKHALACYSSTSLGLAAQKSKGQVCQCVPPICQCARRRVLPYCSPTCMGRASNKLRGKSANACGGTRCHTVPVLFSSTCLPGKGTHSHGNLTHSPEKKGSLCRVCGSIPV